MTGEVTSGIPPRDRRRRKRILTKRNVLIAFVTVVVVFVGISIYFEVNPPEEGLFDQRRGDETPAIEIQPRRPTSETIDREGGADPMLLDAARREQYLGTGMYDPLNPDAPPTMTTTDESMPVIEQPDDLPILERDSDRDSSRISITGTPGGVRIEKKRDQ